MLQEEPRPVAIFDFDGTLVDSKSGIVNSLTSVLRKRGLTWEEPLDWFVGPPIHVSMPQLLPSATSEEHALIVAEYRALYAATGWSDSALYPGVREMLEALAASGWRLFICTAKRRDFTLRILAHFGIEHYFEAVYADSVELPSHSKSELLGRLITDKRTNHGAVMIGDRVFDMEAGKANGLRTIAVTYGYGSGAELAACSPDWLCGTPDDVLHTLQTLCAVSGIRRDSCNP